MSSETEPRRPVDDPDFHSGPLAFMTQHPVAANLLMIILLVGGLFMTQEIRQQVFPDYQLHEIRIDVSYPGSTPQDVERAMIRPIEDSIQNIAGIDNMHSTSREGGGRVTVEVVAGANEEMVMSELQAAIDGIGTFPDDVDRPELSLRTARTQVLTVVVHGDIDEDTLRQLAAQTREGLLNEPDVTRVTLSGMRSPEIAVEVPQSTLRAHQLTLHEIADSIGAAAVEMPGGSLRTPGGEVLVRTDERRDQVEEFEQIIIDAAPDGSHVRVGDIAQITDDFQELNRITYFDGRQASRLIVSRVGDQSPLAVSDAVHDYIEEHQDDLPPGVEFAVWDDDSEDFAERIDLLMTNAYLGLALVLLILGLFLRIKLAFWVTLGIPIAILGSLIALPWLGVSFNMISLFAFLLTLGIVVDYAIVVGESIHHHRQQGMEPVDASITGVREVAGPLVLSFLATAIVFLPLLAIPGTTGNLFGLVPIVVILVLVVALVAALVILPAHLARSTPQEWDGILGRISRTQERFGDGLEDFIETHYRPALRRVLSLRYLTMGIGLAVLVVITSLAASGRIAFEFFPPVEGDVPTVYLRMPFGTDADVTHSAADQVLEAADETLREMGDGQTVHRGILTEHGGGFPGTGPTGSQPGARSHLSRMSVDLISAEERDFTTREFTERWRENVGDLPGVDAIVYEYSSGLDTGSPISIDLTHSDDYAALQRAAQELGEHLEQLEGVTDVDNGVRHGKEQLDLQLRPEARHLGLTEASMGEQLRAAFFGVEALRMQRDHDEIRVYVRRPFQERRSEHALEQMTFRTASDGEIPLSQAATVERSRGPVDIEGREGQRIVNVTAALSGAETTGNEVMHTLESGPLPELMDSYPGLSWSLSGEQRVQNEARGQLAISLLLALFAMYVVLAFAFRSYIQPLIVMVVIPFGCIGAIVGHLLMGHGLSFVSVMGMIALSGIIVNISLLLLTTTNEFISRGSEPLEAIIAGACRRFRPIILTAATTFIGLAPMILETSVQAQFLVPMAISLGFGIAFGAVICLFLVPCTFMMFDDGKRRLQSHIGHDNGDRDGGGVEH